MMYTDSFFGGGGFEVMFFLVFVIIIGIFVLTAVKGIGEWNKNNQSPRLTVEASVAAKRTSTVLPKSPSNSTRYLRQEHACEASRRVHYAVASQTHT